MTELWFNIVSCLMILGFSTWGVLARNFADGIILKKALIVAWFGSAAKITMLLKELQLGVHRSDPANTALNVALAIVIVSIMWRRISRNVWSYRYDRQPKHR